MVTDQKTKYLWLYSILLGGTCELDRKLTLYLRTKQNILQGVPSVRRMRYNLKQLVHMAKPNKEHLLGKKGGRVSVPRIVTSIVCFLKY